MAHRSSFATFGLGIVALLAVVAGRAEAYTLGGVDCSLTPSTTFYCFGGAGLDPYRNAVQDPANFGAGGTVPVSVSTVALSSFTPGALSGVDGVVIPWWLSTVAAAQVSDVTSYFLGGGDLFILADNPGNDPINAALGVPTASAAGVGLAGRPTTGNSPAYDGPFGLASIVNQSFGVGALDPAAVILSGGHVVGTDAAGNVTTAVWDENEFAPGSGRMVITTDIDSIVPPTASYAPLDDNGRFALNATAFLVNGGPIDEIAYDLIGAPDCAINPSSSFYCGTTGVLSRLATALKDPANAGDGAPIDRRVAFVSVDTVTPEVLAKLAAFIVPWVADFDGAPYVAALRDYFLAGGNLWVLQDDPFHDPLGELLGIPTATAIGAGVPRSTSGTAPTYAGPFGTAADVLQYFAVGEIDPAAVAAAGGTVVGTASTGEAVNAAWGDNAYAPGAGRMLIWTDVDGLFQADYTILDDSAKWALNSVHFLLTDPTAVATVEPDSLPLIVLGLVALLVLAPRPQPQAVRRKTRRQR